MSCAWSCPLYKEANMLGTFNHKPGDTSKTLSFSSHNLGSGSRQSLTSCSPSQTSQPHLQPQKFIHKPDLQKSRTRLTPVFAPSCRYSSHLPFTTAGSPRCTSRYQRRLARSSPLTRSSLMFTYRLHYETYRGESAAASRVGTSGSGLCLGGCLPADPEPPLISI